MAEVNKELEEEVLEWARKDPRASRYLSNIPLITAFYFKNHKATRVAKCVNGAGAELQLIIVKMFDDRNMKLCTGCKRKTCQESCGKEDYDDMVAKKFMGCDRNYEGEDPDEANIAVSIAPWDTHKFEDILSDLEEDAAIDVSGTIRTYENNGKEYTEIKPEKITIVDDMSADKKEEEEEELEPKKKEEPKKSDDNDQQKMDKEVHKAVNYARDMLKMNEDKVPVKRWDVLMKDYSDEVVEAVMVALKLKKTSEFVQR